jgi:predicted TIM-barrel fold metal-dependent hydrolase
MGRRIIEPTSRVKPVPAVDCHAHVFSRDAKAIAGARYRPAYAATLEAWQGHWAMAAITRGVLVQPSFFGTDNGEMLRAIAQDRERLRGVAVVDPSFGRDALERLDGAGVRALRFNLHGMGSSTSTSFQGAWRELLERCARMGWHLEVFTDPGGTPAVARALEPIAIDVVFDHFAAPDPAQPDATYEALAALARSRRVHCKLSAPYRLAGADPGACARAAIAAIGPRNIVWGSDWPFTRHEEEQAYGRARGDLESWCGPRVGDVLWDNAARLYRFA